MRQSNKQIGIIRQEALNKERNAVRKRFWELVHATFIASRKVLELRKKETKGETDDNSALDSELALEYEQMCEAMLPLLAPYLQDVALKRLQKIQEQMALDEAIPTPKDKRTIN